MAQITAVLVGGPAHLPEELRLQRTEDHVDVIKLPFGPGYEHFHRQGERRRVGGVDLPVFRWVARTTVAE